MSVAGGLRRGVGFWLFALALSSCAGPTQTALPVRATTAPAAQAAEAYGRMVADLAAPEMEGRGPGTKGLDRARDYIAQALASTGLPAAFGKSYTQPFEIPLGSQAMKVELEVLDREGKAIHSAAAGRDLTVLGLSGNGEFSAPAVFAGYGIVDRPRRHVSYRGPPDAVRGKVVIAFRYEPLDAQGVSLWTKQENVWTDAAALVSKARWAAEREAAALLLVNPLPRAGEPLLPTRQTLSTQVSIPVLHVSAEFFRKMLAAAGMEAQRGFADLQRRADAAGPPLALEGVRLRGKVALAASRATLYNVGAFLRGSGRLAGEVIVVGAHYDHVGYGTRGPPPPGTTRPAVFPGADDNASGAAGLIMLAQRLAGQTARRGGKSPAERRSVLLAAFSGEESGLWGSRYLVQHLEQARLKGGQVVAMLNLDMIGRLRDNRLYCWGAESGDRWGDILKQLAWEQGLTVQPGGSAASPSDQLSFNRLKVPVLSFFTGMHADVHRPTDTPEKINAQGAVKVLDLVEGLVDRLRTDPRPPAYVPPKPAVATTHSAGDAYLGVLPDVFAGGADGCVVMDVVPGGPADSAGVKAGDIIVRWNDRPVASTSALMEALAPSKPGDVVKLQVRREGKIVPVEVRLGRR